MTTEKTVNQVAEYNPLITAKAELLEKYKGLVYDVTIPEQYENAENERKAFVKLNNQIDKVRTEIKKAPFELCKQIDAQAKQISEPLDKRIKELKTALDAENARQAAINAEIEKQIADIRATPMLMAGKSSDDMQEAYNSIIELKPSDFGGYDIAAKNAINEAIAQLEPMIAMQVNNELTARKQAEQQAILDAKQAELNNALRVQQDQANEAKRLADLETARLQGIEQAKRDAQMKIEQDIADKLKAEQLEASRKEVEMLKAENVQLQSGYRSISYAGEDMDESCSESLGDAVTEMIDCFNLNEGDEVNVRSWLFIDLPDTKVRIIKSDDDLDYEIVEVPKPEDKQS